MEFSSIDLKRCTLVNLGGRIDGSVAPELGANLRNLTDSGRYKLVLNMKDVTYTSSAALRELISTWKNCRRWNRGDMRLAEVNPNIRKVLDLTGLSSQFMIYDTEAQAVGSF
jgi:anti-sigma B factor antagonist